MTIASSIRNWLKMKLCGDELRELATLKQRASDMKVWCSHIPVARECGKWLEDNKSYPSQSRGAYGSIEDFRAHLESESLKLNYRKSYLDGGRGSGRTFRLVLGAVLNCSEIGTNNPSTIYVIGNDKNHCNYMHHLALSILGSVNGLDVERDEICMPNGSRILFRTEGWCDINNSSRGLKVNRKDVFKDHYVMESRYGRK